MRKAFNFYQSHWEQLKKMNDKQKLSIFNAICKVQFLEKHIDDVVFEDMLTDIVWTGIKHSLNTSLLGFVNKQKSLNKEINIPLSKGGKIPPMAQGEEEGEEEGEEKGKEKGKVEVYAKPLAEKTIDYLNLKANKNFTYTKGNIKEINAQVKKGYGEQEFAYVIDIKVKEWINISEMNKNLNPVTLFRESNFDRYLNQSEVKTKTDKLDDIYSKGLSATQIIKEMEKRA